MLAQAPPAQAPPAQAPPAPSAPICEADHFPMQRDCAIRQGKGEEIEGYKFLEGTGTWCSSVNDSATLLMKDAMRSCTNGQRLLVSAQNVTWWACGGVVGEKTATNAVRRFRAILGRSRRPATAPFGDARAVLRRLPSHDGPGVAPRRRSTTPAPSCDDRRPTTAKRPTTAAVLRRRAVLRLCPSHDAPSVARRGVTTSDGRVARARLLTRLAPAADS